MPKKVSVFFEKNGVRYIRYEITIGRKRTKPIRRHGFKKAKEGRIEEGQTRL